MPRPTLARILLVVVSLTPAMGQGAQPAGEPPPGGQVLEGLAMESAILGRSVRYALYLPPDYRTSTRRYPVVYLLHGFTDEEWAWVQFGEVHLAADRGIATREIPPMIIVMPDGGVSWYMNDYQGKERWEDMFVEEFVPHVDNTYRTRTKKEFRGISGLSMGGQGALLIAMHHPEMFAAVAAFSSGVFSAEELTAMEDKAYRNVFGKLFGPDLQGQERLTEHWARNSPLELARTLPEEDLKKVRWYLDCGDDDFLYKGNAALHVALRDRKIPHEYRVRDGQHNWEYWRTGILHGLAFIGQSFHR